MNTVRNDLLMEGLDDWVEFYSVHWLVKQANPEAPIQEIQGEVLNVISDLVSSGLYQIGSVGRGDAGFIPWEIPLDQAIDRIRAEYVGHYEETGHWDYCAWLNLTDEGKKVAEALLPTS